MYIKHASEYQIEQKIYDKSVLHIGLCFPVVCSPNETAKLVERVLKTHQDEYEIIGKNFTVISTKVTEASERALTNVFLILTM